MDTTKIVQERLPETQYIRENTPKKQIYIHHTAGNKNAVSTIKGWANNKERVATAFVIGYEGTIAQAFSSRDWAWHLGVKDSVFKGQHLPYKNLDKYSVGIEITNWAYLVEKDGKFYNYVGGLVDPSEVTFLEKPFKNHKRWHKYSDKQIESLRELLIYLGETYDIDIKYNEDIWTLNKRALKGENGLFTHNSVRVDKSDVYPCPRLIKMLKSL
jgi:N-acetyl-anhydromuramyl-L-alanine amidase AmpD